MGQLPGVELQSLLGPLRPFVSAHTHTLVHHQNQQTPTGGHHQNLATTNRSTSVPEACLSLLGGENIPAPLPGLHKWQTRRDRWLFAQGAFRGTDDHPR